MKKTQKNKTHKSTTFAELYIHISCCRKLLSSFVENTTTKIKQCFLCYTGNKHGEKNLIFSKCSDDT